MTMVSSFVTMVRRFPLLIFKAFEILRLGVYFVEDDIRWTGRGCNTPTERSQSTTWEA
jgi:hypothetical protein